MLSVVFTAFSFMLSVTMLSVVMPNVVAPFWGLKNVRNLLNTTFGRGYVKKPHGILSTFISGTHFTTILSRVTDCRAA
jgi:hypothetical protein